MAHEAMQPCLSVDSVAIPRVQVRRKPASSEFAVYEITAEASSDKLKWSVHRRFNDFKKFHKSLRAHMAAETELPPLPEDRVVGRLNSDFLQRRKGALEIYLQKISCHPVASRTQTYHTFIGSSQLASQHLSQDNDPLTSFPYTHRSGRYNTQAPLTAPRESSVCHVCLVS